MGSIAWHYRHSNSVCSYESYLHKTAKYAFFERVRSNTVIPLLLEREQKCASGKAEALLPEKRACISSVVARYNIAQLFDAAALEERDPVTGLTPDIFLRNTHTNAICYVEIHVTHPCTQEKIQTGIPIIEIHVTSEEDIHRLRTDIIDSRVSNVTTYNFKPQFRESTSCAGTCRYAQIPFRVCEVSNRGRIQIRETTFGDIDLLAINSDHVWRSDISTNTEVLKLKALLQSASITDFNCLLCKSSSGWDNGHIWCSATLKNVPYDTANQCAQYEAEG